MAESSEDEGRQFQLKTRSSNRIALCKKEGSDDEDPKDPDCSGGRRGVKRKGTEAIQESTSRNLAKRRQKHPQVVPSAMLSLKGTKGHESCSCCHRWASAPC